MESERTYTEIRRDAYSQERYGSFQARLATRSNALRDETYERFQAACVNYLLFLFFGFDRKALTNGADASDPLGLSGALAFNMTGGSGGSYTEYHYHSETESTTFSTTGTVLTEDGREIEFGLNVSMSRTFVEETNLNIQYGSPVYLDPLVIHLNGSPGELSDQTFSFDLDGDGMEEKINSLSPGSGFLALDKNGDGIINDGSELFGAKTGNGFKELAKYDGDGNGWIDENDDIFKRLKIWAKDEFGRERLLDLKEADVGAICLKSLSTDFSIRNEDNEELGKVRRSGFFLRESDGAALSLQQLDLVRHEEKDKRCPSPESIAGFYEANLAYA
ncbi:MAG: hypothetical protein K5985_07855 [Lachnospiraceae bacterium]|nr:hypothetical protein [Lachnospiraceae bacterium]